ncbi:MAG: agmatinase family protein [Planctomycetes bacterium]|nr:agmatinase family protein [Planctomycetota bacterium]
MSAHDDLASFDPNAAAAEGSGVFGLPFSPEQSACWLLPVPFEATTSYRQGTVDGPRAIFEESHQVDLYDRFWGPFWKRGVHLAEESAEVREWSRAGVEANGRGDVAAVDALGERVNRYVGEWAARALAAGVIPGVVGGDHSVPFALIEACAKKHPGLGILHFDAHMDLRRAYEGYRWSHASIHYNTLHEIRGISKLVQVGIRDFCEEEVEFARSQGERVKTYFDADVFARRARGESFLEIVEELVSHLPKEIYVSFDIDGLDPSLCPHTGTPVPGGLSYPETVEILRAVARSGRRCIGFDLVEVAPGQAQSGGDWDGNVGARVLYQLCGLALHR